MKSRDTRFRCFALLFLFLCFIGAQVQSRTSAGPFTQSFVALPSDLMNRDLTTLYNRRLKLADYSGKIAIVNIFASWCGPCRVNLTDLIKIKQEYPGSGVEVIGLVAQENDPSIASVRRFVRLQKINFPVVWDNNGFGESLVKAVDGRSVLPQTFVIDKDGRIRKHFQGYNPVNTPQLLREALDQIAKEKALNKPSASP
jgi:thiol-disulfide isomerase/thioredoxin